MIELRPGVQIDYAIDRVQWAASEANNAANRITGNHPSDAASHYLRWTEDATGQLGNVLTPDAVTEIVQTQAYWQLRAATGAEPRLLSAVLGELRNRQARLEAIGQELTRWHRRWASDPAAYTIVVPDTTMFLEPNQAFQDIEWQQTVGGQQALRVVVPLAVIDELDRLKRQGNNTTARSARDAIRCLSATLPLRVESCTHLHLPYKASIESISTRYEMTRRPACCSAGSASGVGHTVRPSGTGAFGEHVWAGRSCTVGCEPALVVGRPCDWSGCAVSAYP